jgi:hypothetical protein
VVDEPEPEPEPEPVSELVIAISEQPYNCSCGPQPTQQLLLSSHIAAMVPIKPLIHLVNMGTIKLLRNCNYGYHLVTYIL